MLFFLVYAKASSVLGKRALFLCTLVPFIAFYGLFGFVLYPLRESLHLSSLPDLPEGLTYVAKLMQHWTFTLYYIVSELFGSVGVPLLFWQTANDVVGVEEAKRWYPLFSTFGNLGPIAAGQVSAAVNRRLEYTEALKVLTTLVVAAGGGMILSYGAVSALHAKARARARARALAEAAQGGLPIKPADAAAASTDTSPTVAPPVSKKPKPKMSLGQSLAFLARSEYLGLVGTLVISYGLAIEFTEIMWKAVLKRYLPDKEHYGAFMGQYSTAVGATTLLMTLVGGRIPKLLGCAGPQPPTPLLLATLWPTVPLPVRPQVEGWRPGYPTGHRRALAHVLRQPRLRWRGPEPRSPPLRRHGGHGAERALQGRQIRALRPHQGDGLHTARRRLQAQGQGRHRRTRRAHR